MAGSTTTDGAAHVEAIDWEAEFEREDQKTYTSEEVRAELGIIGRETFFANFKGIFALGGVIPVAPFPLECLPVKPEEEAAARGASDALYDICSETPFLQFLLSPESEWAKRGFAILAFVAPKAMAVRAEMSAKVQTARDARTKAQEAPRPAPAPATDLTDDPQAL